MAGGDNHNFLLSSQTTVPGEEGGLGGGTRSVTFSRGSGDVAVLKAKRQGPLTVSVGGWTATKVPVSLRRTRRLAHRRLALYRVGSERQGPIKTVGRGPVREVKWVIEEA